jgi:hypothetical protein
MAGSLGFGRQYCIPKGKASAEYRFGWLERLETKTATEFRYLRWGLGIVIALVLGLVTKVILDWLMRALAMGCGLGVREVDVGQVFQDASVIHGGMAIWRSSTRSPRGSRD